MTCKIDGTVNKKIKNKFLKQKITYLHTAERRAFSLTFMVMYSYTALRLHMCVSAYLSVVVCLCVLLIFPCNVCAIVTGQIKATYLLT